MSGKYSAFISYNHNPRDSRIALMLQQKLEHFKLPRGMEAQETDWIYVSYNPNTKLFLIGDEQAGDIGVAPYRSLQDMIKEGEELLQWQRSSRRNANGY